MKRALAFIAVNQKTIVLTFELFWIAVFLLEAASKGTAGASQFVYVNF